MFLKLLRLLRGNVQKAGENFLLRMRVSVVTLKKLLLEICKKSLAGGFGKGYRSSFLWQDTLYSRSRKFEECVCLGQFCGSVSSLPFTTLVRQILVGFY